MRKRRFAPVDIYRQRPDREHEPRCSITHPTGGWPCDRPPHESLVHRNAVAQLTWIGKRP
jgi:hypothetical protein